MKTMNELPRREGTNESDNVAPATESTTRSPDRTTTDAEIEVGERGLILVARVVRVARLRRPVAGYRGRDTGRIPSFDK